MSKTPIELSINESAGTTESVFFHYLTNGLREITSVLLTLQEDHAQKSLGSERSGELLAYLQKNAEELMQRLVAHLRARVGGGERFASTNIDNAIRQAIQIALHASPLAGSIHFDSDLAAEVPEARAKRHELAYAIASIFENSIDAISERGTANGLIKIKSHLLGSHIAIDISDDGAGISPSVIKSIFQAGFTTKVSGNGLGLFLAKKLINDWGGDISLLSSSSNGTAFRILLNKWEPPATALPGRTRVLIVEDNKPIRLSIQEMLKSRGFTVESAGSVAEATRLVKSTAFDVAILDIRLGDPESPRITGLDIARIVREHNPSALIIMNSAYSEVEFYRQAMDIGVDAYLNKADSDLNQVVSTIQEELPRKLEWVAQRRETQRESIRREQQDRFTYETLSIFSHELRSPLLNQTKQQWNTQATW